MSDLVKIQRRLTQAELEAFLEKATNTLHGEVDHSEFRGYVYGLAPEEIKIVEQSTA